jgi:hypothetical protein
MQNLSLRYTTWINRKHQRTGHVFQGRFKAILIDADNYLLELVRYIHLNPVRAGIVSNPSDYDWSGHHAYIGNKELSWVTTEWVLTQFSTEIFQARNGYYEFVLAGIKEIRRPEFHSGSLESRILGDDSFTENVLQKTSQLQHLPKSLEEIVAAICQYFNIPLDKLTAVGKIKTHSEARAIVALIIRESADHSLTKLGIILNRDITSLSQAARRIAALIDRDPRLKKCVTDLKEQLQMFKSQI